jgi:hypothetical protein
MNRSLFKGLARTENDGQRQARTCTWQTARDHRSLVTLIFPSSSHKDLSQCCQREESSAASNEGHFIPDYAGKANSFADDIQSQPQRNHKPLPKSYSDNIGAGPV